GWGGRCDEIVGRICLRLESTGDWWPVPDKPRIVRARQDLLARLDSAARQLPGDLWILEQRVAYRVEEGRAEEALELVRDCPILDHGRCLALEGYLLHVLHRFPESENVFERMLRGMAPGEREEWIDPRPLLDREGRELLDDATPTERAELVRRFWELADPLALVEGNDRWTEHLARQVVARSRQDATNPFGLRWGDDLAESLLRYGWEVGWEQIPPRPSEMTALSHAVGHQHPESRSYVPPGQGLRRLSDTDWEDWNPGSRYLPRTGYAPSYAPVVLPAPTEIYRVPRGDSLVVVAALSLPQDTSYHRGHDHPPLPIPSRFASRPPEVGLFARDFGGEVARARIPGTTGVIRIAVPPGDYLLSAEVWAPDSARVGRYRAGIGWDGRPADLPTASDLFLLTPGPADSVHSLEVALEHLLPGRTVAGRSFRVAWELNGFGWQRETLQYRLRIREAPGGFLRRAGRFLGLLGDGEVTTLEWSEAGPQMPGPFFRAAEVSLPAEVGPGDFEVRLEIRAPGRESLLLERAFRLEPASR
ncbi:MAG: hypothetical protein JSU98_15040, partial [Gemmatimonadales bacterium]